ncbi:DUF4861 family protein [Arcicella sp. DC2W]|uniref:DUF4861 family protein n=1 Tax=Arcicella gelida TaxID=2984195 RepID=A0ABU5S403_9BACT|nr:DUF4861 family protein [Arcicella sp. DC2W]MEA5403227.1 DUF4861 family protein [Arcicella sp. DC2W]
MNKLFVLTFTSFISLNALAQKSQFGNSIMLANQSNTDLVEKPVSIATKRFQSKINKHLFPQIFDKKGKEIPSQLNDLDGDGQFDELFFVADIPQKSSVKLSLKWTNNQPSYPIKTSVRFGKRSSKNTPVEPKTSDTFYANQLPKIIGYQPYQTDGPSWENDKVAFRHYFDGRNAKDLFGKRTSAISPENVGISETGAVQDNYHVLKDWGRDILPAGNAEGLSVGLGGVGLLINNQLYRVGVTANDTVHNVEATDFKIVSEGTVKSQISLDYHNWKPTIDRTYQLSEKPTIWPGMYAYQNTVKLSGLKGDETVVIGLSKVATNHPVTEIKQGKFVALYTHDAQSYNKEFIIGLAIIVPAEVYQGYGESPKTGSFALSYYAKLDLKNNSNLRYYAVGAWELADECFKTEKCFEDYLKKLMAQLNTEVSIKVQ